MIYYNKRLCRYLIMIADHWLIVIRIRNFLLWFQCNGRKPRKSAMTICCRLNELYLESGVLFNFRKIDGLLYARSRKSQNKTNQKPIKIPFVNDERDQWLNLSLSYTKCIYHTNKEPEWTRDWRLYTFDSRIHNSHTVIEKGPLSNISLVTWTMDMGHGHELSLITMWSG